jgi:Protein of unknown function (DUF4239)
MPVISVAIVVVVASLAAGLHLLVQRRFGYDALSRHNDVAGFLLSVVGVIYAVVLGFVVIVAWQKYDDAQNDVDEEVAAAIDLYHSVAAFPPPLKNGVRAGIRQYANDVLDKEWPAMARGDQAAEGGPTLETIAATVENFKPRTAAEGNAQQIALANVQKLFDSRRRRVRQTYRAIPPVLWTALIFGAFAVLGFAYLFGVENRVAQIIMTSIIAGLVALMFIVISTFDYPFRGSGAIAPNGWSYVRTHIGTIDQHPGW